MARIGQTVIIRSDKDSHFTTAIAAGAMETESIDFPQEWKDNRIREVVIEGISIQSEDNLAWDIGIWTTDGFDNTDVDVDSFLDYVSFSQATGKQVGGAGQYYYASPDLTIHYVDEDNTEEFHIALINRDGAVAKTAGATGEVSVIITARPVIGG